MSKASKIILTIVLTVVFLLLASAIGNSGAEVGSILGWAAVFVFAGYIGALIAIWKKPKNKDIQKKD